jgi:hypothetical protein
VLNVETLEREFEPNYPRKGAYPIDRKELKKMLAPCLVHTLDAAFAGLVIEGLHKRGVRDVVSIHDCWMAPVALEPVLEGATRKWFKLLGGFYRHLLKYDAFKPLLQPAYEAWQARIAAGDWPAPFYTKDDDPIIPIGGH